MSKHVESKCLATQKQWDTQGNLTNGLAWVLLPVLIHTREGDYAEVPFLRQDFLSEIL